MKSVIASLANNEEPGYSPGSSASRVRVVRGEVHRATLAFPPGDDTRCTAARCPIPPASVVLVLL